MKTLTVKQATAATNAIGLLCAWAERITLRFVLADRTPEQRAECARVMSVGIDSCKWVGENLDTASPDQVIEKITAIYDAQIEFTVMMSKIDDGEDTEALVRSLCEAFHATLNLDVLLQHDTAEV